MGRPLWGRRAADEDRRLARGYSFQIKRISPRASQERFPGGFRISPRDPLETTKGRAAALPLETIPKGTGISEGRARALRCALRGTVGRGTRVQGGVPAVLPGSSPGKRRGWGWPGSSGTGIGRSRPCGGRRQDGSYGLPGQRSERGERSWSHAGVCPMISEFSTGQLVRRFDGHSARAPVGAGGFLGRTVQSRVPLGERTRSVRVAQRERVFSFDGSTAVSFLGRQKENGGGISAGDAPPLRLVNRVSAGKISPFLGNKWRFPRV